MFNQEYNGYMGFSEYELENAVRDNNSGWAVPWSDLMMVMFVLFAVLFVFAMEKRDTALLFGIPDKTISGNGQAESSPLKNLVQKVSNLGMIGGGSNMGVYQEAMDMIYKAGEGMAQVSLEGDGSVRMVMRGNLVFGPGGYELNPGAKKYLGEIAGLLKVNQNNVHIIGHAQQDEGASKAGLLNLSVKRAMAVADYLIDKQNIDSNRLAVSGRGDSRPDLPETSKDNSALNRRVEIILLSPGFGQ